jgi:hypothetical protein
MPRDRRYPRAPDVTTAAVDAVIGLDVGTTSAKAVAFDPV